MTESWAHVKYILDFKNILKMRKLDECLKILLIWFEVRFCGVIAFSSGGPAFPILHEIKKKCLDYIHKILPFILNYNSAHYCHSMKNYIMLFSKVSLRQTFGYLYISRQIIYDYYIPFSGSI